MRATIAGVRPPFAAYLRVYQPLAAFSPREREQWRRYVGAGRAPQRGAGSNLEHEHSMRRMLSGRLPDPGDHAFVIHGGSGPLICPWHTALRAWESLGESGAGRTPTELQCLLPPDSLGKMRADYSAWRAEHPDARSHIRTSTSTVPPPWFALYASDERRLQLGDRDRHVVYVTEMARARRRAARALSALRKGIGESTVTAAVEELARWLEEFDPRSLVELDYGGLAWLFAPGQLRTDESIADVTAALTALRNGDWGEAAAAYRRLAVRWQTVQIAAGGN